MFYFVDSINMAAAWLKQHKIEPIVVNTTFQKGIYINITLRDFERIYSKEEAAIINANSFIEYRICHADGMLVIAAYKEKHLPKKRRQTTL